MNRRLAIALRLSVLLGCGCGLLWPLSTPAQTLTLTNGIQTYGGLTNTTVTMTGRCELWVTSPDAPLPGSLVHLNSADAWLVLPNILPSAVVSRYLGQLRVNGASAIADSNVRVVQYAMGAAVIPHGPGLQPLQVFEGPHFSGKSMTCSQYTAYSGSSLGALDQAISSFKLKRGYMATLAQNLNGTGLSRCYVAQDGDLEISLLPATLDNQFRFIRVFPWRWVSKKGIAGNIASGLNVRWFYNWNLDQNSARDLEYVPIRQNQWWPGLSQNWQTRGANHLLGYNEPDHTDQANLTVSQAIGSWPDLLGTGLRVGAPAVSDGGLSWLYSFIDQADAAGLRVDFVPVHYYRCYNPADPDGATTQFYNFLKGIYDRVKRPLWVTEWNNGANWTTCGDPTYAQQQATIAKIVAMLDSTPFVERYALYNWVEDVRRVKWDDGSLTSAGVSYRDAVSPNSYVQEVPEVGSRSLAQLLFETNTLDSSGYGNNGLAVRTPVYTAGRQGQGLVLDGTNTFIQLPPQVANSTDFSFAAWVYWQGGANWQRLCDFGTDTSHYLFVTPRSGSGTLRFVLRNGGSEQIVETAALASGQWQHVAVTLTGTIGRIYVNGVLVAASSAMTIDPAAINPTRNYLGKSQFAADPLFRGILDEVQLADYALSPGQIAALLTNQPPQFLTARIDRGTASPFQVFNGTLAGTTTDPDAGATWAFSKATGPAWLTVKPDGTITGTPGAADGGTNFFSVRVTDTAGASAFAVLTLYVPLTYGNGSWSVDASGNWGEGTNWSSGNIANGAGYTADFSLLNITADHTVTLDQPRSLGALKFGDTLGAQNWTVDSAGAALTLDSETTAVPAITVNQNSATILAPLAGTNGLAKSGAGTLVLGGSNSLSGTLYIDTSSTSAYEGIVRAAHPGALARLTGIQIRNNNSGSSTLQLDGSLGGITTPADITVSGRNSSVVAIRNLAGSNLLTGDISVNVGGSFYVFQSDAGTLHLGGPLTSAASGTRTFTFQGNGNFYLSGALQNGSGTTSLLKSGAGTLTLTGANANSGTTTVNAGALLVQSRLGTNVVSVAGGLLGGSGVIGGPVSVQPQGTLAPGDGIGTLTLDAAPTLSGTTLMEINRTNFPAADRLVLRSGMLSYGGTLSVTNLGPALQRGDSFPLFSAAGYAGVFAATNLPALNAGLGWQFNPANGMLSVISTIANYPTNLTFSATADTLTLSWPAEHLGWILQSQTNQESMGLSTNWFDLPGSEWITSTNLAVNPTNPAVFYRLRHP